jgi:phosphopantetheinyl transferase
MGSRIVIEPIAAEATLRESATAEDLAFVEQFGSVSRRCEVLAWRAVVRRELGCDVEISHDEYGAPTLNKPNTYISVSHSRDRVAVLFADGTCAVDIESAERDFGRVVTRYLSNEEQQLAEQNNLYAELWCAKEALYKYYKKGGLDFVKDITIKNFDSNRGVLRCSILGGEPIEAKVKREENLVVAVID